MIVKWLKRRRLQRDCWHHASYLDGDVHSFMRSQIIESGKAKMFWCTKCERTWTF
jgi:hypothetical protein